MPPVEKKALPQNSLKTVRSSLLSWHSTSCGTKTVGALSLFATLPLFLKFNFRCLFKIRNLANPSSVPSMSTAAEACESYMGLSNGEDPFVAGSASASEQLAHLKLEPSEVLEGTLKVEAEPEGIRAFRRRGPLRRALGICVWAVGASEARPSWSL